MKHDDFTWDDIILEAPGDEDLGDDELSATDYADADAMEIGEEDPLADEGDPADEDPLADEGDPADEDPLADEGGEDPLEGDPADEDPLADEGGDGSDENPEDEQTDNTESDVSSDKQNLYLVNDYIELYTRMDQIIEMIRTDCKTNIRYNPNMLVVRRNMEKLKEITYDYITNKFAKESYVANLYQFNLLIQALNTNIDLFSSVLASNRKLREELKNKKKNKKKEPKKTEDKKKH